MEGIDRISPTLRPAGRVVQYQRWSQLLFLHWRVPAELLQALVPAELTIDTYDGHAYVGLVPFTMTGVRPAWAPAVPWLSNFHETNVRTYVHRRGRDPGVWFFSLDAANAVAVWIARTFWGLPYHHAKMKLEIGADGHIEYVSERHGLARPSAAARYRPMGEPAASRPGTLEHFLAERYWLYTHDRRGRLCQGQVHHSPYPLQPAVLEGYDETLLAAANIARPDVAPLVHFAREVNVEVFALRPCLS